MTIATESLARPLLLQYHPTISSTATRYQPPASPRSGRLERKAILRKSIVILEIVMSRRWRIRRESMAVDRVTTFCTEHLKENARPDSGANTVCIVTGGGHLAYVRHSTSQVSQPGRYRLAMESVNARYGNGYYITQWYWSSADTVRRLLMSSGLEVQVGMLREDSESHMLHGRKP